MAQRQRSRKAAIAAVLLGVGMGGFVDGIALHQILHYDAWLLMRSHRRGTAHPEDDHL
jgi:uncharacterized membrane protein